MRESSAGKTSRASADRNRIIPRVDARIRLCDVVQQRLAAPRDDDLVAAFVKSFGKRTADAQRDAV
jgi:hypothetical protein